jgi:serine kinase of HPr protein (carbohydrate metabolism regulator)
MTPAVHASAVLVGSAGVLIRGPSGAGKSALAFDLVMLARRAGRFAALVADDRVHLGARHGRLVARAPDATAGLIEMRSRGIVAVAYEPAAVIGAVIDLVADPPRMPEPADGFRDIEGIRLPRLALGVTDTRKAPLALHWILGEAG